MLCIKLPSGCVENLVIFMCVNSILYITEDIMIVYKRRLVENELTPCCIQPCMTVVNEQNLVSTFSAFDNFLK